MAAARRLLVAAAVAAWAASAEVYEFVLSGACESLSHVNGLTFELQGHTARGAPYYKAVDADEYVYHDDDCAASGDGTPKWILDDSAPDPSRQVDLVHDGRCNYQAYINSAGLGASSPPLHTGDWWLKCGGDWEQHAVTLEEISTTTSTSTTVTTKTTTTSSVTTLTTTVTTATVSTTTATATTTTVTTRTQTVTTKTATTTTATTNASTTAEAEATTTTEAPTTTAEEATTTTAAEATPSPTPAPQTTARPEEEAPEALQLAGACSGKASLNGMIFLLQGSTASGAPYYKSASAEEYLYYDEDCSGSGESARWVLDDSRPTTTRRTDLDQDGSCDYHARVASSMLMPPTSATWRMYCGQGWKDQRLTLTSVEPVSPQATTTLDVTTPRSTSIEDTRVISGAAKLWPVCAPLAVASLLW